MVRFVDDSLSFNQLNISCADIPCILENGAGAAARSTQPVTLYITVNIRPPNPYNNPSNIPIKDDNSFAAEATIQGRVQFPTPEHFLPLPHHLPVETGNTMPQSLEEMSLPVEFLFALDRADEAMRLIVPIDRSNKWESTVEKINWVMDTLSPVAEVRVMPFVALNWTDFPTQAFPFAKMAHTLLSVIPKVR